MLATGKSLDIISQCETIESNYKIREDSGKLKAGIYFIKLVDLTTEVRQRNDELFDLLLNSLNLLQRTENYNQLARFFEVKLIEVEGLFPDLNALKCGEGLKKSIIDLKNNRITETIDLKTLKGIEALFKRLISDHIGRDLNSLRLGDF